MNPFHHVERFEEWGLSVKDLKPGDMIQLSHETKLGTIRVKLLGDIPTSKAVKYAPVEWDGDEYRVKIADIVGRYVRVGDEVTSPLEQAAIEAIYADLDFRQFEYEHPNNSTRKWDRLYENRDFLQRRLASFLNVEDIMPG